MAIASKRVESILRRLAAEFFQGRSTRRSLLTITSCHLSADGKRAMIVISVMPREETLATYEFAKRQLSEFQEYVRAHARLRSVPFFDVSLADEGEK